MIIADDFGLDPTHDRVIIDLLQNGVINGTSVMVSDWLDLASVERLKAVRTSHDIQIGLHINLTEEMEGISRHGSILSLWFGLMLGTISSDTISASFEDQLVRFQQAFGMVPDFIDGHQHCHAIWQNGPTLLKIATTLSAKNDQFWMRSPAARDLATTIREFRRGGLKTLLVMWWGAGLRRRLIKTDIKTNSDFSGFIPYKSGAAFAKTYKDIFDNQRADCLIMVHPGSEAATQQIDGHSNALRALEATMLADFKS